MKAIEEEILTEIYRDAFPAAAHLIKRLGGRTEEAKDAFHDALLIYLERKATGTLNIQTSVKAYLLGITKILWLHSRNQYFTLLPEEVESFITEEQSTDEEEKRVLDYILLAGQKCMQMLKAFYYDGLSLPEIASHFGFNGVRSATVQKYKCLQKVRTEIKKMNIYEESAY
jgi:DNA-directed RNA polymerase specialized sigma subunit, sigma24 homolog